MKRLVLLAAMAAFVPGCADDGGMQKMNSPFKKKQPGSTPAKANYFEVKKQGTTYVLGSPESLKALNKGGSVKLKQMPNYGPKGETVAFENTSFTEHNRLVAEYRKSKNLP